MDFTALAKTIRARRLDRGITQQQLADEAGVCRMTIAKFESGVTDARVAKLEPVLNRLGMSLDITLHAPR